MATVEIPVRLHSRCQLAAELMGTTLELWLVNILTDAAESDIRDTEVHGDLEGWTPELVGEG